MGGIADLASSLFGTPAPPSVRRPSFEVKFGAGSAEDFAGTLSSFRVVLAVAPGVDWAEVTLAAKSAPSLAPGDIGSIAAGYEDSSTDKLFTGAVYLLRRSLDGSLRLTAAGGAAALARMRVNQSYEKRTAGDIVRDLATRAGAPPGRIEDGEQYPFYVVDDGMNGWRHVAALAGKNNYVAACDSEGQLDFRPASSGAPVATFTWATDLLALRAWESDAKPGQWTVIGEGAAGSNGEDAWAWVVADASPVKKSAGAGPERLLSDPSLRSAASVGKAALGRVAAASRMASWAEILGPGSAAVRPGELVEVKDAQDSALNGQYLALRVEHHYSKMGGFTTRVAGTKSGAATAGLGSLLGAVGGLL